MARKAVAPGMALDTLQILLDMCKQKDAVTFDQVLNFKTLKSCRKIGEGLYGEVYRIARGTEVSAVKIIPMGGSCLVNGEKQKTVSQVLPEAIISMELGLLSSSQLSGSCQNFVEVKSLHYIQGTYHKRLLKQWDNFNSRKESENDRPDYFTADQKYLLFEFADGGESLEDFKIRTSQEARSIFLQVACALAVAESVLEFEHRDLHWGNVLIARKRYHRVRYRLLQHEFDLETVGINVTVIDYTLSRLRKGGTVMFTDVSEEESLFKGEGDYQFDIYRLMRKHNGNDWKAFTPYTNVLWLHYLLQKLITAKRYLTKGNEQRAALSELDLWSSQSLLCCESATDFVLKCGVVDQKSREQPRRQLRKRT